MLILEGLPNTSYFTFLCVIIVKLLKYESHPSESTFHILVTVTSIYFHAILERFVEVCMHMN